MEVRKVNTPSAAYQGSGPEVAVKPETAVMQETVQSSVPKTEKKEAKPQKPVFVPKADMKQSSQGSVIKTDAKGNSQGSVIKTDLKPGSQGSVARAEAKANQAESTLVSEEEKQAPIDSGEAMKKNSMKRAVEEINRKSKSSEVIFGIHDGTNRVTIKVVDKGTKEVIREFPPEETLDMIAKVWELAGIMIDERG